jgi:hypothetical protein
LENKKKALAKSPRSGFKRKNKNEEGGTSGSRVMKEQKS